MSIKTYNYLVIIHLDHLALSSNNNSTNDNTSTYDYSYFNHKIEVS